MDSFPIYMKSPFIKSVDDMFLTVDIYKRITYADFAVIPFSKINRRVKPIFKTRVVRADTRYPGIIYKAYFDPLHTKERSPKEYCIFDGTHRFIKMQEIENKTGAGFFVITPKHFEGLTVHHRQPENSKFRTTGCGGCEE